MLCCCHARETSSLSLPRCLSSVLCLLAYACMCVYVFIPFIHTESTCTRTNHRSPFCWTVYEKEKKNATQSFDYQYQQRERQRSRKRTTAAIASHRIAMPAEKRFERQAPRPGWETTLWLSHISHKLFIQSFPFSYTVFFLLLLPLLVVARTLWDFWFQRFTLELSLNFSKPHTAHAEQVPFVSFRRPHFFGWQI